MDVVDADAIAELRAGNKSVVVGADFGVDLMTKRDLERAIAKMNPYRRKILAAQSGIVKPDGTLQFRVYDVPDNFIFTLGKFIVWGDAHNPSSGGVYTNAAAWGGLFHGAAGAANLADFWPHPEASTFQVLPWTQDYGALQAPEFRPPDNVVFSGVGFPAGENITVLLFGQLLQADWA